MRKKKESNYYNFDELPSENSSPELENTKEFDGELQTPLRNSSVNSTSYYSEVKPSWENHRAARRIPIESAKRHYKRESFESLLSSSFHNTQKKANFIQVPHPKDRRNQYSIDCTLSTGDIERVQVSSFMRRSNFKSKRTKRRGFKSISEVMIVQNSSVYKIREFKCSNKPNFSKLCI